jgi:putative sterol carrier protein
MRGVYFFLLLVLLSLSFAAGSIDAGIPTGPRTGDNTIPQQVFDGMREDFLPAKSKGLHLRYQFSLTGPNGGDWWIEVNDGKFKLGRGKIANPDVTFITSDNDWVALSNGKLSGTWATLTGRLKVHGSHALARKLDEMCP